MRPGECIACWVWARREHRRAPGLPARPLGMGHRRLPDDGNDAGTLGVPSVAPGYPAIGMLILEAGETRISPGRRARPVRLGALS